MPPDDAPSSEGVKQAVIMIHGMGDQSPMATLRSFVEQVWYKDVLRHGTRKPRIYVRPSDGDGDFESAKFPNVTRTL